MPFPKITIVTPSYNQALYLEATIQSVLAQNYPNLEYFVVDGGSSDGSVEIIQKYSDQLAWWVSEPDQGQSEAINKGLARASGEVITWLNSDDLLAPNALHTVASLFADHPNAGLVHGESTIFWGNAHQPTKEMTKAALGDDIVLQSLGGMPFAQPSAFFHRRAIDTFGLLDQRLHYAMDYNLFAQIALNYDLVQSSARLSCYRMHDDSKSTLHNAHFAREYAVIIGRLLRAFHHAAPLIDVLQKHGLSVAGDVTYVAPSKWSFEQLQSAVAYNLKSQLTFYYEGLAMREVCQVAAALAEIAPAFFHRWPQLQVARQRATYLPAPIIGWLRKFAR